MLFGKKKSAGSVFAKHYKSMLKITNGSHIPKNANFELLPAMFIICDYAAASAGKDRRTIANTIMNEVTLLYTNIDKKKFDRRCDLYGEIIRGKDLRCEWLMGEASSLSNNAISKCTALLGDILYNPECADNYDSAPVMIYGILDAMTFAQSVMKPLLDELIGLFKEIYDM